MSPRTRTTAAAADIIARKRDGEELRPAEIRQLIEGFVRGSVADYQMSAFAMAVCLRGMSERETVALTLAMRDSGRVARLARVTRPKIDKHSTGGVGDKVSLCLAPIVTACDVAVPMISGRGLGHTGGTLDKLEAIPGFVVELSLERFEAQVERLGCALIGPTRDLAPADRRLYALRDVTGTVPSIPLITASILAKKLASGIDGLVMDVKVGRGAFMKTAAQARTLARSLIGVGRRAGIDVSALLTRMDAPLGRAVGTALETAEAFEVLHGGGPEDLVECTRRLATEMLRLARRATGRRAERLIDEAIDSGRAASTMRAIIEAQGGDPRVVDEPDRLPQAPHRFVVRATADGYVRDVDALAIGQLVARLGAGRARADDPIDPTVGLLLHAKPGERLRRGAVLAEVHAASGADARAVRSELRLAYNMVARRPRLPPLLVERARARMRSR